MDHLFWLGNVALGGQVTTVNRLVRLCHRSS